MSAKNIATRSVKDAIKQEPIASNALSFMLKMKKGNVLLRVKSSTS